MFGFLAFTLIFYQVIAREASISDVGTLVLSGLLGLIGGAMFLGLWWKCGFPVLTVLFIGLVMGYLVSSILFYTPLGKNNIYTYFLRSA